jgi:hypothetical protein
MTYLSETSAFLNELIKTKPELQAERLALRATYWEKTADDVEQIRHLNQANRIAQKAYPYQMVTPSLNKDK